MTLFLPTLHVQLLGEFSLIHDKTPLTTVNTPRLQSLLAYLVLHRHAPQPRQRLAFLLWPDSSDAQARTNLRHLIRQQTEHADHKTGVTAALGELAFAAAWAAGRAMTLDEAVAYALEQAD